MVGVAVKVTVSPAQTVVALAAMLTLAVSVGFTVIVIPLEVAGDPVKQGEALLVITTVTISLFANVVAVNVVLLVPTLTPFTFHW